jgi:hypothetical protein
VIRDWNPGKEPYPWKYIIVNRWNGKIYEEGADTKRESEKIRKTIYGYDDWRIVSPMSRKDYELIADAMRQSKPDSTKSSKSISDDLLQWRKSVDALCNKLAANNPRFLSKQFKEACGVDE